MSPTLLSVMAAVNLSDVTMSRSEFWWVPLSQFHYVGPSFTHDKRKGGAAMYDCARGK